MAASSRLEERGHYPWSQPTITSYALCPIGIDVNICKESAGITLAQGPSTYELINTIHVAGAEGRNEINCKLFGTTRAECVGSASASIRGRVTTMVTSTVFTNPEIMTLDPVPVTAGADKLKNIAPATTDADATGGAAATGGATPTGDATATAGGADATDVSTGGVPRVTGTTGWLVGGVAAAMAAVVAL
ncbi:hypothetical protein CISG_02786 [Coccidioides immitis RMSCC 3703]|uniref:Uncharacterized protein n=1 Tax=Coccidioides immitis RMSCC 3703 TaxID=454286 RepID=A0A0J8RCZ2_COCIT|nr:hypothetical protein CISG_02786 [Coccidioides immitis RMSCC 3703]